MAPGGALETKYEGLHRPNDVQVIRQLDSTAGATGRNFLGFGLFDQVETHANVFISGPSSEGNVPFAGADC